MLPFGMLTDEVLTRIGRELMPYCISIMDSCDAGSRDATGEPALSLQRAVERMGRNDEFSRMMSGLVERGSSSQDAVTASLILTFVLGWRAAALALSEGVESVT
jgi:hypothetical protein